MRRIPNEGQPIDDHHRLEALSETGLLDTVPEESFDRYTRMAKTVLRADVSLLSLIDSDRQFFKSQVGLASPYDQLRETPLSHSFCKFVVESGGPLVVEDSVQDERVRDNRAILDLGVNSYLGMPVRSEDGHLLGSICAINSHPRKWSDQDCQLMRDLAAMVSTEIWMRERNLALLEAIRLLQEAEGEREKEERMIAHDLRTPIAAISSCIDLLELTPPPLTPQQTDYLVILRQSAQSMDSLVGQLITQGVELQESSTAISIFSVLRRSANMVRPIVERNGLQLLVGPSDSGELSGVKVNPVQRVLLNLLTNAIKFSPTGGVIVLSAKRESIGGREGFRFEVQDTGPGVAPAERNSIFNEFFVGSAPRYRGPQSHGLGLAFCRMVAEREGGRIGVEERDGGGSIFYFHIPR